MAHRQHVRVQVDVAGACAGHREREAYHDIAIKGAHDLAADFVGDDKHTQRHQFGVAEIPDFFLQRDAGTKFLDPVTAAQRDGVRGQRLLATKASSRSTAVFSRARDLACRI